MHLIMETGQSQEPNALAIREDDGLASQENEERLLASEQRNDRRERAYRLRVVEKRSYADIAKELGVNWYTIYRDVKEIQKQRMAELVEYDKQLIVKQDEIYEALLTKWLPVAISEDETITTQDGREIPDQRNMLAADRVVKILGEQAKLHGLGMQAKAASPADIGQAVGDSVLKAMRQLASGQFAREKVIEGSVVTPALEDAKNTEDRSETQVSTSQE